MSLFGKRTFNRRWVWVSLFILVATVSMVGPSQAISGLLSTSLKALLPLSGSPGDTAAARNVTIDGQLPQTSQHSAHTGDHAIVIASSSPSSENAADDEPMNALPPIETADEDATPGADGSGSDMKGGFAGMSPFAGPSFGSSSSSQGHSGGSGGNGTLAGNAGGGAGAVGAGGGAITPEELADSDLMAGLLPNPSTESWPVNYGFEPPPGRNEQTGHGPKDGSNGGSTGGPNGGSNGGGPNGGSTGGPNGGSDSDPEAPAGDGGESVLPKPTPWGPEDDSLVPLDEDVFVLGPLSDPDLLSEVPDDPSDFPTGGEEWPKDVVNSLGPYDEQGDNNTDRIDAIPEPASLLLFATGAAGLIYRRRKSGETGHGDSR